MNIKNKFILFGMVIFAMSFTFSAFKLEKSQTNFANGISIPNEGEVALKITDENFDATISKGICMVDFWATWCGPCRTQGPIVEELAQEWSGKAKIGKVDVDFNKGTAGKFNIRSIPTIIIFKDGVAVERLVGLQSKETLNSLLIKYSTTK